MRSQEERDAEVAKLRDVKARIPQFNRFQDDHHAAIDAQIATIENSGQLDQQWPEEMIEVAVDEAVVWLESPTAPAPSDDWETLALAIKTT